MIFLIAKIHLNFLIVKDFCTNQKVYYKKKNYNHYHGNKNKNEYINKKRNINPDFIQLISIINGKSILNTNTNFNNKMKLENYSHQKINLISHIHSMNKGKVKKTI